MRLMRDLEFDVKGLVGDITRYVNDISGDFGLIGLDICEGGGGFYQPLRSIP